MRKLKLRGRSPSLIQTIGVQFWGNASRTVRLAFISITRNWGRKGWSSGTYSGKALALARRGTCLPRKGPDSSDSSSDHPCRTDWSPNSPGSGRQNHWSGRLSHAYLLPFFKLELHSRTTCEPLSWFLSPKWPHQITLLSFSLLLGS